MRYIAAPFLLLLLLANCTGSGISTPDDPSGSTIVIESERLVPSATGRFCSVQGTLLNTNRFRVDCIRIDWRAFNAAGDEIALAAAAALDVPAGGRAAYSSTFLDPEVRCSGIARFERLSIRVIRL